MFQNADILLVPICFLFPNLKTHRSNNLEMNGTADATAAEDYEDDFM